MTTEKTLKQKKKTIEAKSSKSSGKKLLKSPKAKLPSYSAEKVVSQLAREQGALVREVEPKEVSRDDRSLFFNEEFRGERKRDRSWLFK
jgi:hypothetical protein